MKHLSLFLFLLLIGSPFVHSLQAQRAALELEIVAPDSVGINGESVENLVGLIRSMPPHSIRGVVVVKDGQLAVEEYFGTFWRISVHDIRSAGKSITALLLGIAIDQGLVKSVDQSIYDFFPAYRREGESDVQLKHLLMMSSGMDADTDDTDTPGHVVNWFTSEKWVDYILNVPQVFEPGQRWVYNDAAPILIGAVIEEQSGIKLADFAEKYLFQPLGITEYYWYTGPSGRTGAAGNLYISALDFAKIGQLVLDKGVWNGEQILSSSWIDTMSTPQMDLPQMAPFANSYSYFWYFGDYSVNGKTYKYYFAAGSGGNVLMIVPAENMVVSILSSTYGRGRGHARSRDIFEQILRSLIVED